MTPPTSQTLKARFISSALADQSQSDHQSTAIYLGLCEDQGSLYQNLTSAGGCALSELKTSLTRSSDCSNQKRNDDGTLNDVQLLTSCRLGDDVCVCCHSIFKRYRVNTRLCALHSFRTRELLPFFEHSWARSQN